MEMDVRRLPAPCMVRKIYMTFFSTACIYMCLILFLISIAINKNREVLYIQKDSEPKLQRNSDNINCMPAPKCFHKIRYGDMSVSVWWPGRCSTGREPVDEWVAQVTDLSPYRDIQVRNLSCRSEPVDEWVAQVTDMSPYREIQVRNLSRRS